MIVTSTPTPIGIPRTRSQQPLVEPSRRNAQEREYRLLEELGRGAMGVVWKGQHIPTDDICAIKLYIPENLVEMQLRKRIGGVNAKIQTIEKFSREFDSVSKIQHPNVVKVTEFGITYEGTSFFSMELIQGRNLLTILEQKVKQRIYFTFEEILKICLGICNALEAIQEAELLHHDLKPANIMIGENNSVTIIDFGLARGIAENFINERGCISGTALYISPEKARGDALNYASDIYSLGVILYQIVTGRKNPFGTHEVTEAFLVDTANVPPVPPSQVRKIPEKLEKVILRALTKEPDKRQQTGSELKYELTEALKRA